MSWFLYYLLAGAIISLVPVIKNTGGILVTTKEDILVSIAVYIIMIFTWPYFVASWIGQWILRLRLKR